ncbi:MAG: hypothetical protein AAFX93_19815 [Verrucomicrobiota bacterium]
MSEGALETLVKLAPKLGGLLDRVEQLEVDKSIREESEGVPLKIACEIISGVPFGEPECITERKCMEMVNRGLIKRVPGKVIGVPVIISRQSIKDYFKGLKAAY